jgi:histidinol-phosphatase (PHP family)
MWSNFHTHSNFCDGKGAIEEYMKRAEADGIKSIGFSSHAPLPFPCKWSMKEESLPVYLSKIESLKPVFQHVEIYKGLEIDFIPGEISPDDFRKRLDYTIGSIHFVDHFEGKRWEIDNTLEIFKEGLENIFESNIQKAVTRYYQLTREMIMKSPPDIIGHLDKIKMHNFRHPLFDESELWYRQEIDKTLELVRQANRIIEVNTRGLYQNKSSTTYPSPWVLDRVCNLGIPVTLSSDAHHPGDLTKEFQGTTELLRQIGFKNFSILTGGSWKQVPIQEYGLRS